MESENKISILSSQNSKLACPNGITNYKCCVVSRLLIYLLHAITKKLSQQLDNCLQQSDIMKMLSKWQIAFNKEIWMWSKRVTSAKLTLYIYGIGSQIFACNMSIP